MSASWLWMIALIVVGLLLVAVGRWGARASVAGQVPPEQGPDLKSDDVGQRPDIRSDDQPPDAIG